MWGTRLASRQPNGNADQNNACGNRDGHIIFWRAAMGIWEQIAGCGEEKESRRYPEKERKIVR